MIKSGFLCLCISGDVTNTARFFFFFLIISDEFEVIKDFVFMNSIKWNTFHWEYFHCKEQNNSVKPKVESAKMYEAERLIWANLQSLLKYKSYGYFLNYSFFELGTLWKTFELIMWCCTAVSALNLVFFNLIILSSVRYCQK